MFRVLSLDGGGIRGAFAAAFLSCIEEQVGAPITNYFDLITGTSTGGIIALALGVGEPAARIKDLYQRRGPEIFTRRPRWRAPRWERACVWLAKRKIRGLDENSLYRSKYDAGSLRHVLTDLFGNRTMQDATSCRLVIPSVDLSAGRTITFKTPHQPDFIRDRHLKAVDVALATAAAPTFFPHAIIGGGAAYSDGGLWANNPAIVGYVEAMKIRNVCCRPGLDPAFGPEDIYMLSIGTGEPTYYANPGPTDDGLLWWGPQIFGVAGGAQSQGAHFQAQYLMGTEHYTRVDFKMPAPWRLDDVSAVSQLLHYGGRAAADHYPQLRQSLLATCKSPYHPFPDEAKGPAQSQ